MTANAALFRLSILSALGLAACGAGPISGQGSGASESAEGESAETGESAGGDPAACLDPTPILQLGTELPSGFVECGDGFIHRQEIVACMTAAPSGNCVAPSPGWGCQSDAECGEGVDGVCNDDFGGGCWCQYGCNTDADCSEGTICACAGVVDTRSRCVPADCLETSACADGLCGLERWDDVCGVANGQLGCTREDSSCRFHDECPTACEGFEQLRCSAAKGWQCQLEEEIWCGEYCGEGRPFLVDEQPRTAEACSDASREWSGAELLGRPLHHAALAAHWTRAALFEHASVASFNRFALELLALGAPPQLLRETLRAAADEVQHAELAFALASRYGGAPLGPGPLAVADAIGAPQVEDVARSLIVEACVGETLAAIEAHHAASAARDPEARLALELIAEDELRHAELGWACLRWLLDRHPELHAFALRCLDEALTGARAAIDARAALDRGAQERLDPHELELRAAHGLLDSARRGQLRVDALERVIGPCVEALRVYLDPPLAPTA